MRVTPENLFSFFFNIRKPATWSYTTRYAKRHIIQIVLNTNAKTVIQ